MFRRSLYIFGAIVLLGLLLTVGYALLQFRGPGDAIADAQALFDRGEYLRVVADLDISARDRSLQRDPSKRRELLRLRYLSHSALGNSRAALRDLDDLMAETSDHGEDLLLDHVRLLAFTGRGERALQEARAFLARHPEHGRALELAGEACQTTYQEELRSVLATIEVDVGPQLVADSESAVLVYLYRPDADAEVRQAIESLRQTYAGQSRLVASWPPLSRRLDNLRARVQESLGYFQQSLEREGLPVAAFRGLALSLEQSQRFDDLLILCECYRRRFDHEYVLEAGAIASWALVRLGLEENAIATAIRWLPPGTAEQRFAAAKVGDAVLDLFLARIVAAWQLRDLAALDRLRPDARALLDAGLPMQLANALANGLSLYLRDNQEGAESSLANATRFVLQAPTPHGQQDLLRLILPVRIDNLRRASAGDSAITELYGEWIAARPNAVEPLIALAEYQLDTGKYSGAMATVRAAQRLAPQDEDILALRVRAARPLYRDTEQDGPGLLAQCIKRRTPEPEVPDPVCYLLCGEAALAATVPGVALACGRAAVDAMPWARAGRLLEARAELLADRPEAAARLLRGLVDSMPPDEATLQLALAAHRAAGLPVVDLLWRAMRGAPPDFATAADLLRQLQRDAPAAALPLVRALLAKGDLPAEVAILTASAFARAGDRSAAERLLRALPSGDTELGGYRGELADAVRHLLRLAADAGTGDAALAELAMQWSLEFGLGAAAAAPVLLQAASEFAELHPSTAYALITLALGTADPADRGGAGYALAGDLAFRLGQQALAENHWTAALAFPDGRIAAEPLARLCLATDRPERALQVYRLATAPTDPALALRCGNPAAAERIATAAIARDGGDLLSHVTMSVIGKPSLAADLVLESTAEREAVLELATLLRREEFARLAVPRARELATAKPVATAQLLLARAHALAGDVAAAARLHTELWTQGLTTVPYWREVALCWCRPRYEPAPVVASSLIAASAEGKLAASPFAFTVANMRMADTVEAAGHGELAIAYRTPAWLQYSADLGLPRSFSPTLASVDALLAAGRALDAWWVLDRIRPTLEDASRHACVERMLTIAGELGRGSGPAEQSLRRTIYGAVVRLAASEGALGSLVDFLLVHADAFRSLAPSPARRFELLTGHLALAAAGWDDGTLVPKTINRLLAEHGLDETLAAIEKVLRAHPLALELWHERTVLLQQLRRGPEGVADLRRVLAHVVAPRSVLELVAHAARDFALTAADIAALEQLDAARRNSPKGKFVQGLVALRRGRPDRAVTLLEAAGAGVDAEDGALRLLALAQALLQSSQNDAVARAVDALSRLEADYPSSSEARYAGSFARQLSPR